jgi:lipoyl(octanoyl) transferase
MRFRLIVTEPASGAWNMALDHALMDSARAGGAPVLRLYRWSPACLSLGRNQPADGMYDADALAADGFDLVRRPTGGRAVWHQNELTYAVVGQARELGGPRGFYLAVNRALRAGLVELGVPAELQPATARAVRPSLDACFREPAEGELVLNGRKLIGSAQYREAGAILQHGSLLIAGTQDGVHEYLVRDAAAALELASNEAVLAEFLDPLPEWDALVAALARGWEAELACTLHADSPSPGELRRAATLEAVYRDPAWTWRC